MDVNQFGLLVLRIVHAVAAVIWLGGGMYYLVAVRPQASNEFVSEAQRRFREWARPATLAMIATGVVLLFEGLSSNSAGVTYAAILAVKIALAIGAFWLVTMRRRRGNSPPVDIAVYLGLAAFILGVAISTIWPAD